MEPRFGHDFSDVRVHADGRAAASAQAMGAGAYTVGHQIVMGNSRYRPDTAEGKQLLAHELAHVVQQRSAVATSELRPLGEPGNAFEVEADRASQSVMQNGPVHVGMAVPAAGAQFGLVGCMWYMWRFSRLIDDCRSEFERRCGADILSDDCQDFMGGTGFPSDAILRCVGRRNPEAMARLLSSCSTVSLGRVLRASADQAEPPPETDEGTEGATAVA